MITMRVATAEDADVLLEWRNDPATRAASLSTAQVDRRGHINWLERTISDPARMLYIGESCGVPVGTVRFDQDGTSSAEVSITVAPAYRGKRFSLPLLQAGLQAFANEPSSPSRIMAQVREENAASRALFDAAGFTEVSQTDGVAMLSLEQPVRHALS